MKKLFYLLFVISFFALPVFSIEADDSVDEIIKRTYNTGDASLPKLPKTSPKSVESLNFLDSQEKEVPSKENTLIEPAVTKPVVTVPDRTVTNIPSVPQKANVKALNLGWNKKINVRFNTSVSDRSSRGTKVVFVSQAPLYAKSVILPAGTIFYGTVVNSHSPQILGNGGLLSIKIEYVNYSGKTSSCEGNIIAVNYKNILFNNIKGKNGYFKGIAKVTKPARTFYTKSVNVSKKLADGPGVILVPFTYLPGAVFLLCDSAVSPFVALFHKGDRVNISKGTNASIKLTSPIYVQY